MRIRAAVPVVLAIVAAQPAPGRAQGAPDAARVGTGVTERIVSHTDPSKSYATFVPSGYRPGVPAPLVIVLDPRGRALVPLERIAPTAERLGYVVMSSYDSRSDEDVEPTERAVAAMIDDAQDHFAVDTRRLYFVGFSGTARTAWLFGQRFAPYTAGIIGVGAGLPYAALLAAMTATGPIPFAFYGGSGELDFNWEELRRLDRTLDGFDVRHHVTEWDGGHTWPDAAGFARALEWLDTDAVGLGLQVRAHDELSRRFEAGLARAAELEAAGRWTAAWREYTTLVGSFDGLLDTDRARVAAERLAGSELWERERASIDRALEHRRDFDRELGAWLQDVRRNEDARSVRGGIDRLDVEELQETARSSEDRIERQAARRMLESLHVYAVFYETEARIAVEAWEVALAFLDLAEVIHPDDPRVAFARARIYARDDRFDEAFEALDVLEASGLLTPGALTESEDLAPLRGDARYVALLERLAGEPAPLTR